MARRSDRWEAHPVLAWWVRVAVLLVPIAVSVVVALVVIALLPEPHGAWHRVAWWVAVVAAAYAAALLVDRVARRALPLAVLLRLSLVFPDRAPSRLKTARRTSLREIERQVESLQLTGDAADAARTLVSLVGALGLHDRRTRGHSERVRAYVDLLTDELGLAEEDRVRLRWAALLHDIGKLSVPGVVLNGGRDLAEDDWAALRRHPAEGERLAAAMLPWLGEWGRCVREHHERWDGSGYPEGLRGTEISLGARIVAVADAFEVMTANRSYQQAVKATAAREELARCAGKDFDPAVVRAFLQVSLGRIRGVLGPLAFLPALPLAAITDRAGRAAQGLTTVAAVSAVALTVSGTSTVRPAPVDTAVAPPPSVSLPAPQPVAQPVPSPTPAPSPPPAVPPAAPRHASRPAVHVAPARPALAPTPQPAGIPPLLYVSVDALVAGLPAQGSVTVQRNGRATTFGVVLDAPAHLSGSVTVVLLERLQTRHGNGLPSATVSASLLDCASSCRTLATSSAPVARSRSTYAQQELVLGPLDALVRAGDTLRLALSVSSHDNVTGLVIGYGGSSASRLLLG